MVTGRLRERRGPAPGRGRPGAPTPRVSGRPTRGNSRIEGTRPVRSGLPPPPSRLPNLDREETRAGFPYSFRGFCRSRRTARRAGRAHRATLSVPVSSLDFRGERLRRRLPSGCSVYATVDEGTFGIGPRSSVYRQLPSIARLDAVWRYNDIAERLGIDDTPQAEASHVVSLPDSW